MEVQGYGSYPNNSRDIYPFNYCVPALLFTKKLDKAAEIRRRSGLIKITFGVAELPRLENTEKRRYAQPSRPSIDNLNETPILNSILKKEHEYLFGSAYIQKETKKTPQLQKVNLEQVQTMKISKDALLRDPMGKRKLREMGSE